LTLGIDLADSWSVDGHKWLQVPYDCGFAVVRHELAHRRAMTIAASYLPSHQAGERMGFNYVPELSRAARGNAVWAVIKTLGRQGIAEMVERHCAVARSMAERLARESGIAILNDVVLNQIAVRFGVGRSIAEGDDLTKRTIRQIQQDGICFAEGANWCGREIMRISVSSMETNEEDGRVSTDAMISAWQKVRDGAKGKARSLP
jgi:glutamate/tyrosine decarboxylase-like PLP-dependent enzyme